MFHLTSSASREALQALKSLGILVSHSQVEEIIASLLGYPTAALLIAEHNERSNEPGLDEAEILVLDHQSAERTAVAVLPAMAEASVTAVIEACVGAIANNTDAAINQDVDELFETWADREIAMIIENVEGVDRALLQRMGPVQVDDQWSAKESLWASRDEWVIEAKAEMREVNAALGKPSILDCVGYIRFRKAGRAGLQVVGGGASCSLRAAP